MTPGVPNIPDALKENDEFNTSEKIDLALRNSTLEGLPNGGIIYVSTLNLQYQVDNGTWYDVDPADFPPAGVSVLLPYPAGSDRNSKFSIRTLITSGNDSGTIGAIPLTIVDSGLLSKFNSIPVIVAIGFNALPSTPTPPPPLR